MTELAQALRELEGLDRAALVPRWAASFGCPAPRSIQAPLLRAALAWQLQVRAHPEWRRPSSPARLARSLRSATPGVSLAPGTRLLREWQGSTHHVKVLEKGFEHEGRIYRSLSALARHITGTAWSGPLFFGLR